MKKTFKDLYFDKERKKLEKYVLLLKEQNPEIKQNVYPEKLMLIIEKCLEVYAHAYCMDVKTERKKTSKVIYNLLCELKR